MKRWIILLLAKVDGLFDALLYRPAIVKAFGWIPRRCLCDLAKLSVRLDHRWSTHYWDAGMVPEGRCVACGRRAAWLVIGGWDPELDSPDDPSDFLRDNPQHLCGWCQVVGPIDNRVELDDALAKARARSVACRWRPRDAYSA